MLTIKGIIQLIINSYPGKRFIVCQDITGTIYITV